MEAVTIVQAQICLYLSVNLARNPPIDIISYCKFATLRWSYLHKLFCA